MNVDTLMLNLSPGVDPFNVEECNACMKHEVVSMCDFHQGVEFGVRMARHQMHEALERDDLLPGVWHRIVADAEGESTLTIQVPASRSGL